MMIEPIIEVLHEQLECEKCGRKGTAIAVSVECDGGPFLWIRSPAGWWIEAMNRTGTHRACCAECGLPAIKPMVN